MPSRNSGKTSPFGAFRVSRSARWPRPFLPKRRSKDESRGPDKLDRASRRNRDAFFLCVRVSERSEFATILRDLDGGCGEPCQRKRRPRRKAGRKRRSTKEFS